MTRHSETHKRQFTKRYPRAIIRKTSVPGWYQARLMHHPGHSPKEYDIIAGGRDVAFLLVEAAAAVTDHRREATA